MRRASLWTRKPGTGTRRLLALVLTVLLAWCAVFRTTVVTPRGVQCPTAAVQTVAVAKRDCCGRVVGYEVRKPREGERGFLQCRCAEKKIASQQAVAAGPRFEIAPPAPLEVALPAAPPSLQAVFAYAAPASDWRAAPPARPPALS